VTVTGNLIYPYGGPYAFSAHAYPASNDNLGEWSIYDPNNSATPSFSVGPVIIPSSTSSIPHINLDISGNFNIYCRKDNPADCNPFAANPSPSEFDYVRACTVGTFGYIPYTLEDPVEPPIEEDPPIIDPPVDVCPNIEGIQDSVPACYEVDEFSNCMPVADYEACMSNPSETGQCSDITSLSSSEVIIGQPLSGNAGCSYGDGGAVTSGNYPDGSTYYTWQCYGTLSATTCTVPAESCPPEAPTPCYGQCIVGTCEAPPIPPPNPGIGGQGGKVVLNPNLKVTRIINPGESCTVAWGRDAFGANQGVFVTSTTTTRCTLSDQNRSLYTFDVADLNADTSYTHENVIKDENYTLRCFETNDPSWPAALSTGSCRLNIRPQEFN
jgi:hypothetical protein